MVKKTPGWKRMLFKNNKVWASVDSNGNFIIDNKKVLIKYQVDQDYEYKVLAENLKPLDSNYKKSSNRKLTSGQKNKNSQKIDADVDIENISSDHAVCIYTDGASSGNPGPSGIGVWLKYKGHEKSISKFIGNSTNNIAELEAIKAGLNEIKKKELPIRIFTDSSYAYGLLVLNWKAHKNRELVQSIRKLMSGFKKLKLIKVKGHSGIQGNEIADQLAVAAVENAGR
ncbi:MAG: ribonuclease HI [Deltaproteobacteria bacterium]|nr:ribonuclease HI [Deltaproteobacteria bacterium]